MVMMENYDDIENSFDNENNTCDLAAVIAEFPEDDAPGMNIPIKKLSDMFDSVVNKNVASSDDIVNMQVYVRIRPTSNGSSTIKIDSDTSITTIAPESSKRAQYTKTEERHYNFTHIYGPSSKQTDVFNKTAAPLLERFLQGDSCVLFAYGMTNAGKTYTIQGTSQEPGVLPRLVSSVLEKMNEQSDWELQTSMFEIYQEKIYDLLSNKKDKLSIRDGNGRVEVLKLSSHHVSSAQDAIKLLDEASVRRTKSNTLLNSGSSRSHAVYSLTLVKKDQLPIVFQVVDLAGAERGNRTKATSAQQKEANNINVSLMQLWRCLQGMRKKDQVNPDIIPFRESKLTHILMPLLSRAGLAGTGMVVCVNPQVDDYDETISILSNAALACNIKEIANLGRIGTVTAHPQRASAGAVLDKKEETRDRNANKKRSADGNFAKMAARDSMICIAKGNPNIKRTASNLRISAPCNDESNDDENKIDVADVQSELKSLKIELASLREQNQQLLTQSIARETEIRMEVSEEMAERSSYLLEQIQDLQEQLYSRQTKIDNVARSCKKIKKRQVEIAAEDSSRDLKEAEEELERVKAAYEADISKLRDDKVRLEKEVAEWKTKADAATKALIDASKSTRPSIDNGSNGSVKILETTTDSAANAFSQRMQRDQRFKKSDEGLQRQASRSSRSPLAPKDGNSPLVRQSLAVEVKGGLKRKSMNDENYSESPMKKLLQTQVSASSFATDENNTQVNDSNGGYLKKLRSHFIRG